MNIKKTIVKVISIALIVVFALSQCAMSFAATEVSVEPEATKTETTVTEGNNNKTHTITYHDRDGEIISQLTQTVNLKEKFTNPNKEEALKYIDAAGNGTYYNFDGWALSTENRNKPTVLTDKIYNNENDLDFYAVYRISKATAAKLVVEGKASSAEVGRIDLTQSFLKKMYDKLAVSGGTTVTYLGDNTSYLLSELVKTNTNSTSESNRYGVAYNLGNFNADNRIFAENGYQFQGGSNIDKVNELPWYKAVYNKTANQWTIYASLPAQTFLNASGGTWIYDGTAKEATATLTGEDTDKYTIEYKIEGGDWTETIPSVTNVSEGEVVVEVRAVRDGYKTLSADPITLQITPKSVTVTAENKTKVAGTADPTFTATEDGLLGNDKMTYSFSREDGEAAGTYTITPSGESEQGNYAVTYETGTLRITEAPEPIIPVTPPTTPTAGTPLFTAATPATTPAAPTAVIADEPAPLATIEDEATPKAAIDQWALINLILTVFTTLMSIALIIFYFTEQRREDEDEDSRAIKRRGIPRILSAVWAIAMVIVFFLTEDMTLPMAMVDKWTWLMGAMAIVQIIIAMCSKKKYDEDDDIVEA